MWGLFSNKQQSKVHRFLYFVDDKVKNLLEWTKYFKHKHDEHDRRLSDIEQKITLLPTETDMRQLIDMHYLNHDVRHRLNHLHSRINTMSTIHQHVPDRLKAIHEKIRKIETKHSLLADSQERMAKMQEELAKKPVQNVIVQETPQIPNTIKSHFREKLVTNLAKNSKNYVKNSIVSMIKKYGSLYGAKIKEMIVEDQKLCSKSSLYRILSEIEAEYNVNVSRQGKDKIYSFESAIIQQNI